MIRYSALLDANVLYSAPIRDILLEMARSDLFRARWTEDILREWFDAMRRNRPDIDIRRLERTRTLMNSHSPDVLVTGYESLIDGLQLPDRDDRHVLAAAVFAQCDAIITQNLSDFPSSVVETFGIEVYHPDAFMTDYLDRSPVAFCTIIRTVRARMKNPPYTVEAYLANLQRQGLVSTVSKLQAHVALL